MRCFLDPVDSGPSKPSLLIGPIVGICVGLLTIRACDVGSNVFAHDRNYMVRGVVYLDDKLEVEVSSNYIKGLVPALFFLSSSLRNHCCNLSLALLHVRLMS